MNKLVQDQRLEIGEGEAFPDRPQPTSRERVLLPRGMKGVVSVYLSVSVVSISTAYNGT